MSWKEEYWKSIKSFDTEEKLDLFFYRPFGFVIAKACLGTPITPTALTVMGLLLGILSGFFFYHNDSTTNLLVGSALFILAGVFDSSDGQLARMGGKSTKLGLILDGICDNIVFGSVYAASILTLMPTWGWTIWPIAIAAGFCHSLQSSLLDFYNREYLVFGVGRSNGDYWNPSVEEAKKERDRATGISRFLLGTRITWIWQQNALTTRTDTQRKLWKAQASGPRAKEFQALYCKHNRTILRFWRLMGANFHTILILLFVFLRRFDLYLILGDLIFLNLALFVLRFYQGKVDKAFVEELRLAKL
jgi:hypothetical protein